MDTAGSDTVSAPVLCSVQVGAIAPLGPKGVPSGFVKRPLAGPVAVGLLNLAGDAQADLTVHGGPDKAVYAYALANYAAWAADFPDHRDRLIHGVFGENLTIDGLCEADLCVGDVHAIGSARLRVCQPRQPCFKLGLRFDDDRVPRAMNRNHRSGWYYRVVQTGALQAGDAVTLVERPNPHLAFTRLIEIVYRGKADPAELAALARADGLADWIRDSARAKLA